MKEDTLYTYLLGSLQKNTRSVVVTQLKEGNWKKLSGQQLLSWIDEISNGLALYGMREGMRIGVFAESSPEWIVAALAIWKNKGTAVLLNHMVTPEENLLQCRETDLSAVLVSPMKLKEYAYSFPNEIPLYSINNTLGEFRQPGRPLVVVKPTINDLDDDIAVMILTSGTTGDIKIVSQTHRALITQSEDRSLNGGYHKVDTLFSVLPYFHVYPLVSNVILPLRRGINIVQIDELNLENIQKAFRETKPIGMVTTPRLLEAIYVKVKLKFAEMPAKKLKRTCDILRLSYWLHSQFNIMYFGKQVFKQVNKVFGGKMRNITCGGAPLDPFLMQFYESCGLKIHVGYGLSETCGPITYSLKKRIPGSVGPQIPSAIVAIDQPDEDGIGEVTVKGNMVMKEYFRRPKDTDSALQNGVFHTGDVGYIDKKGNLFLTGRKKELIVSSTGKKTSPIEIEKHFHYLPHIEEMVALGVRSGDGTGDEAYLAVILKDDKDDSISVEEKKEKILEAVSKINGTLPTRLKVRHTFFTDHFPKTNLLKVKRKELEDLIILDRDRSKMVRPDLSTYEGDEIMSNLMNILQHISHNISPNTNPEMRLEEFGMDSLMALQFLNLLKQDYGDKVQAEWIYTNPKVGELVSAIRTGKADYIKEEKEEAGSINPLKDLRWRRHTEEEIEHLRDLSIDKILITGATGVLGGKVLLDLLKSSDAKLVCLLRSSKGVSARDRLLNILELYNDCKEIPKDWLDRIQILEGDLNLPNLGIDEDIFNEILSTVGAVVHLAAKVSLHGVYDEVADINVGGTNKVIDLCLKTKNRFLLYVSSYSMFGDAIYNSQMPLTELDMDVGQHFKNLGYQQTKFESEILVRAAKDLGLKWIIVRPGDIYGDSNTGVYPLGMTNVGGIYYEMIKTIFETGVAANTDRYFDLTPVDYVSQGILYFLFRHRFMYGTFHLKNPQVIKFSEILKQFVDMGMPLKVVPVEEYKKMLANDELKVNGEPYNSPAIQLLKFRPEELLNENSTWVDSRRTAEVLAKHNIICPAPDMNLLQTYFSYCISIGYFKMLMEFE